MLINQLFSDVVLEDKTTEFKTKLNKDNPIKWAKTLVAFANNGGGIMFVGVSNDGEAFGIDFEEIDKTKNLVALINDRHIFPHIKFSFSLSSVDANAEKFVLGIKVFPSDSIVRYKDGDFNETVFIKGDGNTTVAKPEDIIALSRRKVGIDNSVSDVLYEESQWKNYLELCKYYRGDSSVPSIKDLQNEEIVSKDGYAKTGLLMFKDDYEGDETLICCRLWKGKDKSEIVLDSSKYKGPISLILNSSLDFIERNTKTGWRKTSTGGRIEIRSYPKEAIREALVNAIAHRDYSIMGTQIDIDIYEDRIDIVSPGSWLLPKEYDEYPVGSIPSIRRNAIIAACLDVANLMERGGTGFQTIINSYKSFDETKQPVVMIFPGFLDLRLYDLLYEGNTSYEKMTDKEIVIELLKSGSKPAIELQNHCRYRSRSRFLLEVITPLIEENVIERIGNPKSPNVKYSIKK
ncbi:MAG: putative DNA binding domain-containing protein [Sphaerochaetaceae bacterium]|nr:putative DNA binding domain-containing protein [Sphaerochaetaceae bacterium]